MQIISKDTIGNNISLGDNAYFDIAKSSYNRAIARLNNAAREYLNTDLATSARCVGSSPDETPVTSETDTGTYTNSYSYFSSYNNKFKEGNSNINVQGLTKDQEQMKNHIGFKASNDYWFADRRVTESSSSTSFGIAFGYGSSGGWNTSPICKITSSGKNSYGPSRGLRPVFTLKSNINYVEANGTKILIEY